MEGAILLLLFSAFLVFVVYRMDQNERRERIMKQIIEQHNSNERKELIKNLLDNGFRWESEKQPIDVIPIKEIRKRKK